MRRPELARSRRAAAPPERRAHRLCGPSLARSEGTVAFPPEHVGIDSFHRFQTSDAEIVMIPDGVHLHIGSLLFEGVDQIDLTGPFEVLSRIPNSTYRIYGKTAATVRDLKGLRLTLDVLHVPGGFGQEALMEDTEVLDWIRRQATGACRIFSVCTGALLCGAAGLLKGRRATTHWASFDLLHFFGALPVNQRVVVDGNLVSAAGVTAGIDGALRVAAELRGIAAAQAIQLSMVYAPEPPFNSGSPET